MTTENETPATETPVTKEPQKTWLFRHATIRRFRVDKFEFKNGELRIRNEEDYNTFMGLMASIPEAETIGITEVDEEAIARASKPVGVRAIRGTATTEDMLTAEDRERILRANSTQSDSSGTAPAAGSLLGAFKNTMNK